MNGKATPQDDAVCLEKNMDFKLKELEDSLVEKQQETLVLLLEEIKSVQTRNRVHLLNQMTEAFKKILEAKEMRASSTPHPIKPSSRDPYSLKDLFTKDLKLTVVFLFGITLCFGVSNTLTYFFMQNSQKMSNSRVGLTFYGSILKSAWPHLSDKEKERLMKLSKKKR